MNFEGLANELLLDVFEYLSAINLLRTFHGLNARFDNLLFIYFRSYPLDFRSVSKRDFDIVCQQYLPLISDRIISLYLSNDDETPEQIECFISHNLTLHQFTYLRSLSLYNLRSIVTLSKLMTECHNLHHLTNLSLIKCEFLNNHTTLNRILNDLWALPKLTYFNRRVSSDDKISIVPFTISTSLQYLTLGGSNSYNLNDLASLFKNTPALRHLYINLIDDCDDQQLPFAIPSMIKLNVSVFKSTATIMNLLKNTPNLCYLIVNITSTSMNGHELEQLIVSHLPKLKVFRLHMSWYPDYDVNMQRIDEILESFQTRFWLEERQWYVRCDWDECNSIKCSRAISLYTLPHSYHYYNFRCSNFKSKSTCHRNSEFLSYNDVKILLYQSAAPSNRLLTHYRFTNIRLLDLRLPVDGNLLYVVQNFNHLTSLRISTYDSLDNFDIQSQLQTILDRAPRLCSLQFSQWSSSSKQIPPLGYSCKSVRHLDLQHNDKYYYNSEQCVMLSRSPLGIQCELLSIAVENREDIINLINMMSNLRALCVCYRDDASESADDELIEWLQLRLPSTCMITRDDDTFFGLWRTGTFGSIRVWIS